MRRLLVIAAIAGVLVTSCSSEPVGPLPPPPVPIGSADLAAGIVAGARPTVVNVWASWCLPCRSEAPLIATASTSHPDVRFIGLNVKDNDPDARRFIGQYLAGADMEQFSDASGRVPIDLGGTSGVPITFFYRADASLADVHLGIIDEPTMARLLDEIDR